MVSLWSRFEFNFDAALLIILSLKESRNFARLSHPVPVSFKEKEKYWKFAFKNLDCLKMYRSQAINLLEDAREANKDRNLVIHSLQKGFTSDSPLTLELYKKEAKKSKQGEHSKEQWLCTYEVTEHQIDAMIADCDRINTRLLPLICFLISLTREKNI